MQSRLGPSPQARQAAGGGGGGGGGGGVHVHPNLHVTTLDGVTEVVRVSDQIAYFPRAIHAGPTDIGTAADPVHGYYQHHEVTGPWTNTTNLVDALMVEINVHPSQPADVGAVLGMIRAMDCAVETSVRALAGQLFVYDGAQGADREAIELGVHCALPMVSRADNRTSYHKVFGTTGMLITAFTGPVEAALGGGTAVDANTAIAVATINSGGTPVGFKQFEVFWDKNQIKAWQVDGKGNVVAGGGGNNTAAPAYGFLDTLGDVDIGTGIFWAGNDAIGFGSNSAERFRVESTGVRVTGTAIVPTLSVTTSLAGPTTWGLGGVTPSATQSGWAPTTATSTLARGGNLSTMTVAQLGDILWTLIGDLKNKGVLAG